MVSVSQLKTQWGHGDKPMLRNREVRINQTVYMDLDRSGEGWSKCRIDVQKEITKKENACLLRFS